MQNQIEIFQGANNEINVEVKFEDDTVWLSQAQIIKLFNGSKSNISEHIKYIFESEELTENSTVRNFRTVQMEGKRTVSRDIIHYNLDVIISVGYRVNSKRGVQFRQWATQKLKDFLVKGYSINEFRLAQKNQEIQFLHDGIRIMSRAIEEVTNDEAYKWLDKFSKGLQLLDDYDHERLDIKGLSLVPGIHPHISEYESIVNAMRTEFDSSVFGKKKDAGFESAISQIEQGFDDSYVYQSIEERAAMLLYLIIKNHAFVDGNKRIGAACFLLFLMRNNLLLSANGVPFISNDALASITLFVAASKPEEMETVKGLVISVLNRRNL
ncbi:MAG: type II toxin-antitoxin system death-on-curing family toxin [Bacteroidetes bacterium]|nr:type II toxin-antitoxin system death-on-curing family toxin [Bacteroidota bacterium]